jgi:hypothetical protein
MTAPLLLDDRQLVLLADLVANHLLAALNPSAPPSRLVDAGTLAGALGVERGWVYQHADKLGAVALGDGPKPRLRFDVDIARAALARSRSERSQAEIAGGGGGSAPRRGSRSRRLANGVAKPGSILAVRPRGGDR